GGGAACARRLEGPTPHAPNASGGAAAILRARSRNGVEGSASTVSPRARAHRAERSRRSDRTGKRPVARKEDRRGIPRRDSASRWRADRSAPTTAKASRQGRRGAGLVASSILTSGPDVSNKFGWPRGDSNSHVLSDIGS